MIFRKDIAVVLDAVSSGDNTVTIRNKRAIFGAHWGDPGVGGEGEMGSV
jgi:hypothetical protein